MTNLTEPTTHTATVVMRSHPVHVAQGLRMMARHMGTGWDLKTAHPTRLTEAADEMESLLWDAIRLVGADQHDREIRQSVQTLRDAAEGLPSNR